MTRKATASKTIIVADNVVPSLQNAIVAKKTAPMAALLAWSKENSIEENVQKFAAHSLEQIVAGQAKLRQTAYEIGLVVLGLKTRLGVETFSEFAGKVLPTVGISRTSAYSLIGRVETMHLKFPHPITRAFLLDSTNGRGLLDSQTGNLSPNAVKAYDEMGNLAATATEADARKYAETFLAKIRALGTGSRSDTGVSPFQRKRDASEKRLQNYKAGMDEVIKKDKPQAADAYAEDIEDLFGEFIKIANPKQVEMLSASLERIAAKAGKAKVASKAATK